MKNITAINLFFLTILIVYGYGFFFGLAPFQGFINFSDDTFTRGVWRYWFNSDWSTDDALQQAFPFYKAIYPDIFAGDLVTKAMEGYLTPLHYWLSYGITIFTKDPVMTGHYVMLIQLIPTLGFVYFAVRNRAGIAAGLFALTWMLHTRHVMQRITGGLPRGWAAPVIAAYLWAVLSGSHKKVLIVLAFGCLAHPPSTIIAALAYGLLLLWRVFVQGESKKDLIQYIMLSPLYAVTAYLVVKMPAEVGTMASFERASSMLEFSRQGGRFPFVPLLPLWFEVKTFGFHAFFSRMYRVSQFRETMVLITIALVFIALIFTNFRKKIAVLPASLITYFIATFIIYLASRQFAFRLYVPDRHLQFPLAICFIVSFSSAVWLAFDRKWISSIALLFVGVIVCVGSGHGLYGPANYNTYRFYRGGYPDWLKNNTPMDALIAGHPQHLDPVPLFAMRKAYITYETAHPFYDKYYEVVKKRLEVSLAAHYAKNLRELYDIVVAEGIDYFVFQREQFYPEKLEKPRFFRPFFEFIMERTAGNLDNYAFRELPEVVDLKLAPYMPFKDAKSAIIDIAKLGEYLGVKK